MIQCIARIFYAAGLLTLTACSATPHHKKAGDPCHLPYLDGSKYFVASMYAYEGKGKPTVKKWSKKGNRHGAVRLEPPVDGFPKNLDVILVLNSYEPLEWQISPALAKKTGAVLLTGYHMPRISGLHAKTPVIRSSYEEGLSGAPICRPLAALYGDTPGTPRHRTTASTVHGLLGLGLDRIGEAYAPTQMNIPGFQRPYVFLND
jgi:hypothetical protein